MSDQRQIHSGTSAQAVRIRCARPSAAQRPRSGEEGSILIFVALAMTVVLGMMGLALDVGRMYATKQQAQAAADAAALAGALDLYNGSTIGNAITYATDYAALNGFPNAVPSPLSCSSQPWCNGHVLVAGVNVINVIEVKITQQVNTTFMRVLGVPSSIVIVTADAAVALGPARVPIAALANFALPGALTVSGSMRICGGPSVALHVNSSSASSVNNAGTIDLSHAGPLDPGDCSAGTGAGFANVGSQPLASIGNPPVFGSNGAYTPSASPVTDPLLGVVAPAQPALAAAPMAFGAGSNPYYTCPIACTVMSPGYYPTGIATSGFTVFLPGIYWIDNGGFLVSAGSIARMETTGLADPTGNTNWTSQMLIYNNASSASSADILNIQVGSGAIGGNNYPSIGPDCPTGGICLTGSPVTSAYEGMLFFQNRNTSASLTHTVTGGFGINLAGTIYLTNGPIMAPGLYQTLNWLPGGGTNITGEILADAISIGDTVTVSLGQQLYLAPGIALVR